MVLNGRMLNNEKMTGNDRIPRKNRSKIQHEEGCVQSIYLSAHIEPTL